MAVPIFNKTETPQHRMAKGNLYHVPVGEPGQLDVPPSVGAELASLYPNELTLNRAQALADHDIYAPNFTKAHREYVEQATEKELAAGILFLSAGREVRKPKSNDKDLLKNRLLAWMVSEQTVREEDEAEEKSKPVAPPPTAAPKKDTPASKKTTNKKASKPAPKQDEDTGSK